MKKYVISGLLILALVLPVAAKAQNTNLNDLTASLLKQIELLKQQIADLQTQVSKVEQQVQEIIKFTKTLRKGVTDEEVKRLQEFLKTDPEVYPEGIVSGYFGPLTEKAVKKFQEKHAEDVLKPLGLSEGTGVVGAKTIETMNKVLDEAGKSGKVPPGLMRAQGETAVTSTPGEEKITICHTPPENPANRQTIAIGKSALEAHLAHGDTLGACNILQQPTTAALDNFAKCLAEKGTMLYGMAGCPYCQKQMDLFGEPFKYIKYVECSSNAQLCREKGITAYPTWILSDGNKLQGVQDLVALAKYTGCALLTPTPVSTSTPVACAADVKVCPDGSYVPRIAPNCEFAPCPTQPATQYSITILSPNGGETWTTGSSQYIKWWTNIPITYKIMTIRLRDSSGVEHYLLENTENDMVEQITIPTTLTAGAYTLEIKTIAANQTVFDSSNAPFNIVTPTTSVVAPVKTEGPFFLKILYPNGGEQLETGKTYEVHWTTTNVPLNARMAIRIVLAGGSYIYDPPEFSNLTNTGKVSWTIPENMYLGNYRVDASVSFGDSLASDASDNSFKIISPGNIAASSLTVVSPNGGETWYMGKTHDILWKSSGVNRVNIEVNVRKDGTPVGSLSIAGSDMATPASTGKYSWTLNSNHLKEGNQFKIVVRNAEAPYTPEDESDSYFSIVEIPATSTDTTPPITSNVSANNISAHGATITWTTNEAATSYIQWGLTSSYSFADSSLSYLVTSHSVTLSALQQNTIYHYKVVSKDAAGNPASSNDYTLTTSAEAVTPIGLLAPTMDYFKWGSNVSPCRNNLTALFKYQRVSDSKFFNVYVQYPGQQTSTKYTYEIPAANNVAVSGPDKTSLGGSTLDSSGQTSWQWQIETQGADAFSSGPYRMYATVTGTDGKEGPASAVLTSGLSASPAIISPANNSTVAGLPLVISLGNTVSGLYYNYFIYNGTSQIWESRYTAQTSVNAGPSLVSGQSYQIYVDGFDNPYGAFSANKQKCAVSNFNYSVAAGDTTPPSAPANLTAALSAASPSSQINLSWTASTDNVGVTGYRIYRMNASGDIQIATTSATSYSVTGLSPSTTYNYFVIAYDAAGNTSPKSAPAGATTKSPVACTDTDNGYDFTKYGEVKDVLGNLSQDTCIEDLSGLVEFACQPDSLSTSQFHSCVNDGKVCSNGACVAAAGNSWCKDSDSGYNFNQYGIVEYLVEGKYYSAADFCSGEQGVTETACDNKQWTTQYHSCVNDGKICQNGACVASATVPSCTDSDGGYDFNKYGTVEYSAGGKNSSYADSCISVYEIVEGACSANQWTTQYHSCKADGKICQNGACVFSPSAASPGNETLNQVADVLGSLKSTLDELLKILK